MFKTIRRYKYDSHLRFRKVAYDIPTLEIVTEALVASYGYGEQEAAVIPSLESRLERVYAQFFRRIYTSSGKRQLVHIYLGPQPALPAQGGNGVFQ